MSNLLIVTNSNFSQMAVLQIDPDQRAISAMPLGIAAVSENVGTQVPTRAARWTLFLSALAEM